MQLKNCKPKHKHKNQTKINSVALLQFIYVPKVSGKKEIKQSSRYHLKASIKAKYIKMKIQKHRMQLQIGL